MLKCCHRPTGDLIQPFGSTTSTSRSTSAARALSEQTRLAVVLDAVHGADPGAKNVIAPPLRPYREEIRQAPRKLRIALMDQSFSGTRVDAELVAAVREVGKACAALGHEVTPARLAIDWERFFHATHVVWTSNVAAIVDGLGAAILLVVDLPGAGEGAQAPDARELRAEHGDHRAAGEDAEHVGAPGRLGSRCVRGLEPLGLTRRHAFSTPCVGTPERAAGRR